MESWLLTFGAALSKVAAEDPAVHNLVVEVQHLLKPGSAYEAPEIADRIMQQRRRCGARSFWMSDTSLNSSIGSTTRIECNCRVRHAPSDRLTH
jgi:hypothetical protein